MPVLQVRLTDDEQAAMKAAAKAAGVTMTAYIKSLTLANPLPAGPDLGGDLRAARALIEGLEEEVRQLKRRLAAKVEVPVTRTSDYTRSPQQPSYTGSFGVSRPAPKPGQKKG